jgi:hypothetical protein
MGVKIRTNQQADLDKAQIYSSILPALVGKELLLRCGCMREAERALFFVSGVNL